MRIDWRLPTPLILIIVLITSLTSKVSHSSLISYAEHDDRPQRARRAASSHRETMPSLHKARRLHSFPKRFRLLNRVDNGAAAGSYGSNIGFYSPVIGTAATSQSTGAKVMDAGQLGAFGQVPARTGSVMGVADSYGYWGSGNVGNSFGGDGTTSSAAEMQMWQGMMGPYGTSMPQEQNGYSPIYGMGYMGTQMSSTSPYSGYLQKQIQSYPIMIYTLSECIPCQRAKHLLAVHYPDVRAHFLELSGNEPWQQQLQVDLQYLTGAITFPYIFVCGRYIGGSSDLFELHESGRLRPLVSQCLKTATMPK